MSSPLYLKNLYDSQEFRTKYTYSGDDLGAICRDDTTTFSLWSPLAVNVDICLYADGSDSPSFQKLIMHKDPCGVWRCRVEKNLHGTYYQYRVNHGDIIALSADPYARACGLNGDRSMVVDLSRTDPEGWEQDRSRKSPPKTSSMSFM